MCQSYTAEAAKAWTLSLLFSTSGTLRPSLLSLENLICKLGFYVALSSTFLALGTDFVEDNFSTN